MLAEWLDTEAARDAAQWEPGPGPGGVGGDMEGGGGGEEGEDARGVSWQDIRPLLLSLGEGL
jgi:hypothetical protein